jgi:type IV pilus assembly protein PilO
MALDIKAYFANVPKKQLYGLAGLLVLAVLGIFYYLVAQPLWDQRGRLQGELERLEGDLNQKRAIAANRARLEADITALQAQLEAALVRLPEEKDIPRLLTQVNTLGQQNGLEFLLFRPGTAAKKGFYAELPIEMKVEGQYHTVGAFLDRVSKLERIVNVSDIKMMPLTGQKGGDRSVLAEMRATTFTFLEKGGSAGAPTKK